MICDYNLKFKKDFGNLMKKAEQENKAMDEKKSIALDFLKSVKQQASEAGYTSIDEYLQEWSKFVDWRLQKSGVPALGSLFIQEIIKNPTQSIQLQNENTTSSLDITVETKQDFRKDFLEKIYDGADNVRQQAVKSAEYNFSNALLFDRDNGRIIRNKHQLNSKIKEYQQELMDVLFNYLKSHYSKQRNRISSVDYGVYSQDSVKLYEDGKYTGIFETIFPTASNIFNTFTRNRLITEYQYQTDALKAFNAFQTLLHFDEFLLNSFGDAITISDMKTRFSNEDKYGIVSTKATSMFWNNQQDDDINLSKSINNISKLLVSSTRMYDFKTGLVIPNTYLNFGQFISVITKIKDLAWNRPLSWGIKLNERVGRSYVYDLSSLSQPSQDYIRNLGKNATLATLINETRRNTRRATSAIFELLSSKENRAQLEGILSKFNNEEKNVIVSLNEELFKAGGKSLRAVQDIEGYTKDSINYLGYLLQTTDSTWLVKNCQYSQSQDTDKVTLRTLLNSNIQNIQRQLNDLMNIRNNPQSNQAYLKYNANYTSSGFSFMLNNHLIEIDNTGRISVDKKGLLSSMNSIQSNALQFIDDMLHQNFLNNPKYLDNYISTSGVTKFQALSQLFQFSAELLHGQYAIKQINEQLNKNQDVELSKSEKITKYAKQYYSDYYGEPSVNYNYGTIDIVPSKLLNTLETLSEAKAITDGSTTSTQISDSEGKALSTSTASRLVSSFELQFELHRNNPNSPLHTFAIVNDPNTFVDIQTVREFKPTYGDSKTYNQFNTREFLESSILYDFITPIVNSQGGKYSLIKPGTIALTPSVNSDKNTISKLLINLQYELSKIVKPDGTQAYPNPQTAIIDFIKDSPEGFYNYINQQLGGYYSKIFKNIKDDLAILSETLPFKTVLGDDFKLDYSVQSYEDFNSRLSIYNANNPENQITARQLFDEASRQSGVQVNEQLHVIFGKQGIQVNHSLIALYNRHKDNQKFLQSHNMPTIQQFFGYKNTELLQSLIKNKVSIDIIKDKQLYKFLKDNSLDNWISKSGKLVLAKYKNIDITSESDLRRVENVIGLEYGILTNNPHLLAGQIEINPIIEKQNLVSYLYSQEFILSTVGSHINHPNKKAKAVLTEMAEYMEDEAARFQAQHKRNVSNTAVMHEFALNQFNGIPGIYNIAVIQDINDLAYNLAGDVSVIKPFDGATFVNPFIVYLENNSLNGERAGIHKKQFVHFYDDRLGTGGIIKTAGFGLTNSWMRRSPFMERMMRNMTDVEWDQPVDITKRIQNKDVENNTLSYPIVYSEPVKINGVWTNRYYKVTDIKYRGNNDYDLTTVQIAKNGNVLSAPFVDTIVGINSNYKVWKYIFQGTDSLGLNPDGSIDDSIEGMEQSIKNTVTAINECGYLQYGDKPEDQNNFYQPMKHSDTHYLVTEGAIKQGAANFNTKDWYYRNGQYNRFKIRMEQAGIQLDKEHHADDSEISMMTQVISACAALGYTWNEANSMYRALYQLTKQGIAPIAEPLRKLLQENGDRKEFDKSLTNLIIKSLSNGSKSKDGVLYTIAYDLIEKYRNNEIIGESDIKNNPIPVSDPILFNKVQSLISSTLTSAAIKLKFKGILSVLVPSHETIKLYGNNLRSDFVNFNEQIAELQAQYDSIPLSIQDVEIGRTYKVVNSLGEVIDRVHIQAPFMKGKGGIYGNPNLRYSDYYTLREQMSQLEDVYLIEDVTEGRNLGAYFCTFQDTEGNKYNFYDLKDSYDLYHSQSSRKQLQKTLANLKNGVPVQVTVDGITKTVQVSNLNVKPYEVVMPKTMATQLGLTQKDNVEQLLNDKNSFTKKLISNLANKIPDSSYTVALKRVNGQHQYIITQEQFDKLGINSEPLLQRIDPSDNKLYRIDEDGNNLYELSSENDKVYTINGQEVIITNNLDSYIDKGSYNTLYVSNEVPSKQFQNILNIKSKNRSFKNWKKAITNNEEGDIRNARQRNNQLGNIEITNDGRMMSNGIELDSDTLDSIQTLGAELYNSFKKSLNIIAARIPAQSMQSFMPMKVVGYEDFDINTAYVSTHQIWLQGSKLQLMKY